MNLIISAFYLILLLGFVLASGFIAYHIIKYSLNKASSMLMLLIFISGIVILLITNVLLFLQIDFSELIQIPTGTGF